MKVTPINEVLDLEDGQPVIAVEGTVKYAGGMERGIRKSTGQPWNKQFFVLSQNGSEVAATMWDAEGNEMKKGENVLIENTQNKKGQWSGMVKGSYTNKKKELCHTLEIRANQVKIKPAQSVNDETLAGDAPANYGVGWSESLAPRPSAPPARPNGEDGVMEAKRHLVQSSNLYNLCLDCVQTMIDTHARKTFPDGLGGDMFQAAVSTLYIESSRAGFVAKMPSAPLK